MAKQVILYGPIFSFTVERFLEQMEEFSAEDVTLRINSPGGSVFAGWGMVAKSLEHEMGLNIQVEGAASSMMAIFLLFHKNVTALNVSKFTLHRASTFFTPTEKETELLKSINDDIRKAFEKKLNIPEFEKIAGVTLDEFFNSEEVIDVNLNAKQAKKIGLINKITNLEAADFEASAFEEMDMKFAAFSNNHEDTKDKTKTKNDNKMTLTLDELKAKHPELYAEAYEAGEISGTKKETDRIGSWMVFVDVDPKAVKAGIESGEALSQTTMAELNRKAISADALKAAEEDNADDVNTDDVDDDEPTATSDFEKEVNNLTLKSK